MQDGKQPVGSRAGQNRGSPLKGVGISECISSESDEEECKLGMEGAKIRGTSE